MARKTVEPIEGENEENQYVTISTGGPGKYYNRRRLRKVFAEKPRSASFVPVNAKWYLQIVQEIAIARRRQKISQAELGGKLGTVQSAISQFETGKSNPTVEFLDRILTVLKLSVDLKLQRKE